MSLQNPKGMIKPKRKKCKSGYILFFLITGFPLLETSVITNNQSN